MKCHDIPSFKKHLRAEMAVIVVIAKEHSALLRQVTPQQAIRFAPETFTASRFTLEVETLSFFEKKVVVVEGFDELSKENQESVLRYVQSPQSKTTLFVGASTLTATHKLLKAANLVLSLQDEKPWDKEKRLVQFAEEIASKEGVCLEPNEAKLIITYLQKEESAIENEVKKLACYASDKKKITKEDLQALFIGKEAFTSWQLADKILADQFKEAVVAGKALLEEGTSLFALLAHLRQQFTSFCQALTAYETEGFAGAQKVIAYLKEPKMQAIRHFGHKRLVKTLVELTRLELKAKNSQTPHDLLLELFLCHCCSCPTS